MFIKNCLNATWSSFGKGFHSTTPLVAGFTTSSFIYQMRSVTVLQEYHPHVEYNSNKRFYCNRFGSMEGRPR